MNQEKPLSYSEQAPDSIDGYMEVFAEQMKAEELKSQEWFQARDKYLLSIFFKIADSTDGNESQLDQTVRFNELYRTGLDQVEGPSFSTGQIRYFARITAKNLSSEQAHDSPLDILYLLLHQTRESQ